jgi:MtN3 and saliva related transmembrane protein
MDGTTLLGLLAGTLTTVSFFPQLYQAWKSRSTKDISLVMYLAFCAGILLWLIYGLLIGSLPVILANAVTLALTLLILLLKLKYR